MADFRAVVIVDSNRGGASHSLHKTFSTNPDVELAALADPVDEGRERFTGESGAATGYADYREMLQHERPDIAVIAQHWYDEERVETFLAVVESGVKGIMLEKPAAAWPEQADRMLAAVEAANIPVVMAHRSRENPAMREIKRRGQSGEWGPLIQLKAHGKGDHRAGTTDTLILGTHELDAMIFITGEPPATCWGSVLVEGRPASRADAQPSPNYGIGQVAGDRLFAGVRVSQRRHRHLRVVAGGRRRAWQRVAGPGPLLPERVDYDAGASGRSDPHVLRRWRVRAGLHGRMVGALRRRLDAGRIGSGGVRLVRLGGRPDRDEQPRDR